MNATCSPPQSLYQIRTTEDIGYWVAQQVGGSFHPSVATCIGLKRDREIVAGVIFEEWNGRSLYGHFVFQHVTPAFLAAAFDYPFNVVGAHKLIGRVPESHTQVRALLDNLGYTLETSIADAHPDGALLYYTLTREQCRFLSPRYQARLGKS